MSRGLSLKPVLNELEQFNGAFDRRMAHPWTYNSSGDHKPLIMQLMIVLAPKFWGLYKISTVLLTQSLTRKDKACKLFSARMTNANSCIWSHKLISLARHIECISVNGFKTAYVMRMTTKLQTACKLTATHFKFTMLMGITALPVLPILTGILHQHVNHYEVNNASSTILAICISWQLCKWKSLYP